MDLSEAEIQALNLSAIDASRLVADRADLQKLYCDRSNLSACTFINANLTGASFVGSGMLDCDFSDTTAPSSLLRSARIENCTARGACFDNADFTDADLTETDFSRASFKGAKLTRVSASATCLRGADLSGADLRGAFLECADLRGADLTGANLDNVNFDGADLRGVVGDDAVLATAGRYGRESGSALDELSETMMPVVGEVIKSAGKSGIDTDLIEPLLADVEKPGGSATSPLLNPETMQAVANLIARSGQNSVAVLMSALQQPAGEEPPPEVQKMIIDLRSELGLDESANADDVFEALTGVSRPESEQT